MPYVYLHKNKDDEYEWMTINEPQVWYLTQSDFDGDGLHVAVDRDSDGDGYCDDQEIGYDAASSENCGRFDATVYPKNESPRCKEFTTALLAKEKLQLNDRASCQTLNGAFCSIASYGINFDGDYGVKLGVSASVGSTYSAKSILLRDKANVHGSIETGGSVEKQSSTVSVTGMVIENTNRNSFYSSEYSRVFDDEFADVDFSLQKQRIVNSGETVRSSTWGPLARNTEFIFNSESRLKLGSEENIFVGSLKFQAGSSLVPSEVSVVIHVGNDFQWNGLIVSNDMVSAAKHVKIYYHGTNRIFIHKNFAGTIVAPNAEVVVGQSDKTFYGAIYAKKIVIHQNTKMIWVPFETQQPNSVLAGIESGMDDFLAYMER